VVLEWLAENSERTEENFYELNPRLRLEKEEEKSIIKRITEKIKEKEVNNGTQNT
jgi:hypothetical protein